jgi:hypothetical protein
MLSFYTLLESGVYEPFSKNPAAIIEEKVQKLFSEHTIALPVDVKYKLAPYYSKPPHLHDFPKIHTLHILSNLLSLYPSLIHMFSTLPSLMSETDKGMIRSDMSKPDLISFLTARVHTTKSSVKILAANTHCKCF